MTVVICPVDGKPCAQDCPDRYTDRPEGGCLLTTCAEMSGTVMILRERPRFEERSGEDGV